MKYSILILTVIIFSYCHQQVEDTTMLQNRIDSLERKIAHAYKPGLGEFMSGIQVHHAKLWFAAHYQNWELADFEVHEIMETLDNIQQFQKERKESQRVSMLLPALDSVNKAIQQKDSGLFKSSFIFLTNNCNQCHRETGFAFNTVKIPTSPPFSNQLFKKEKTQ